jgi:2'-5' RNA ligase
VTGHLRPLRLFIAIPVSAEAKRALDTVIGRVAVQAPGGVRWVHPEGIHLNVKFLGNVEPTLVNPIAEAMGRAAAGGSAFRLQLAGLGMFPSERRPRVLWAGVAGNLEALEALQGRMEAEMSALSFPPERRPFSPHLTLGRVGQETSEGLSCRVSTALQASSLDPTGPWQVETVNLMRSDPAPGGSIYSALASVPIGRAVGPEQ